MFSNIRNWSVRNQDAITWFIIGYLVNASLDYLSRGDYTYAAILSVLIAGNFFLRKVRLQ